MSTNKQSDSHAIILQRTVDMQDVAGVYAVAAQSTASRLVEARKIRDSGGLDDDEYLKLLKTIEAEDKLMTSAAKNMDKAVEIRDRPASSMVTVDYDAKLLAVK